MVLFNVFLLLQTVVAVTLSSTVAAETTSVKLRSIRSKRDYVNNKQMDRHANTNDNDNNINVNTCRYDGIKNPDSPSVDFLRPCAGWRGSTLLGYTAWIYGVLRVGGVFNDQRVFSGVSFLGAGGERGQRETLGALQLRHDRPEPRRGPSLDYRQIVSTHPSLRYMCSGGSRIFRRENYPTPPPPPCFAKFVSLKLTLSPWRRSGVGNAEMTPRFATQMCVRVGMCAKNCVFKLYMNNVLLRIIICIILTVSVFLWVRACVCEYACSRQYNFFYQSICHFCSVSCFPFICPL